jgi:hypothetical protein
VQFTTPAENQNGTSIVAISDFPDGFRRAPYSIKTARMLTVLQTLRVHDARFGTKSDLSIGPTIRYANSMATILTA